VSDETSDADALAAAERVLALPSEEQIPYLIRFSQHVIAERDRLRDATAGERNRLHTLIETERARADAAEAERDRLRAVVDAVPELVGKVMRQVRADHGAPLAGDPDTIRVHIRDALDAKEET
jgi:hypothetical protein